MNANSLEVFAWGGPSLMGPDEDGHFVFSPYSPGNFPGNLKVGFERSGPHTGLSNV